MTELTREELIGAYLDGELSSEEKVRAEQMLAESAESRQMLEELRALRSNLQSLPRLTLPADFSQRVLQRAEREMLLGAPTTAATRATVARPETVTSVSAATSNRWVRPLVYAGFAIAAALLIAVILPQETNSRHDVAVLKEGSGTSAPPTIPADEQLAASADRQPEADAVAKHAPAPAMAPEGRAVPAFSSGAPAANKSAGAALPASKSTEETDANEDLLIVELQITQAAFARGEFQQLLHAAEIEVAGTGTPARAAGEIDVEPASPREESAAAEAKARTAKEGRPVTTLLPTDAEMFYVEATSEQLEAALASIDTKNADFPALVVEPAANQPEQMKWRMEFRRIPASEQSDVAEDELSGKLRHEVDQVLRGSGARQETRAVESSATSTARRIDAAGAEAPPATPEAEPAAADKAPRMRAVFVLRIVADQEPAPTTTPAGVE